MKMKIRLFLGFGILLVLLAFIVWISYNNSIKLLDSSDLVIHTEEVKVELKEILVLLIDAETGQRGYIITGEDRYLEPYALAISGIGIRIENFRRLTLDNQFQQENSNELKLLIEDKFNELEETIDLKRAGEDETAREIILSDKGKDIMDSIRALFGEMEAEEDRLLEERSQAPEQYRKDTNRLLIILLFLGGGFGLVIPTYLYKSISEPIHKLIEGSKEFQKKNFKTKIDIHSGDELEDLGKTFNQTAIALSKMNEEYEQLEKAKTEFLSITSHELRSPMTPMRAQLQMLLGEYYGKLNAKQRNAMEIVSRNTKRLDNIIIDFIEISRIETARLKFRFVKKNPADIIPRLVKEMKGFMPEKNIKIMTKIENLPIIEHDKDRLSQVLRNLMNNAIKFSKPNTTVTIHASLKNKMIEFSITDQGIGIDPKYQKRIFEPFFQAEQTIYREHQGTGLGLAIIKGIVESQEGHVWLESKVGKGTTFFFTIPLKPVKTIRPIKLLFSSNRDRDAKIKIIFTEALGPMGMQEFKILEEKNQLTKKGIVLYANLLIEKNILSEANGEVFKSKILDLFKE